MGFERFLEMKRPVVFFDLETTGLDTFEDRIVEMAMVRVSPDGGIFKSSFRCNPMRRISKEATEVHGITNDHVKNEQSFKHYAPKVEKFMAGCDLAGFNIKKFDLPMLMNEMARYNSTLPMPCAVVDCCEIFFQLEPRDLQGACQFYCDSVLEDAHNAMADVEATLEVFEGQLNKYRHLPTTLSEIASYFQDPDAVDLAGKLKRKDGKIVLTFGKHAGKSLDQVRPDYLMWMKKNNVIGPDAVSILDEAISQRHWGRGGR